MTKKDYELKLPVAGPLDQQSHPHSCSHLRCSAPE